LQCIMLLKAATMAQYRPLETPKQQCESTEGSRTSKQLIVLMTAFSINICSLIATLTDSMQKYKQ